MSSRTKSKAEARARVMEMRAAQARADRRRRVLLAVGAVGVVLVLVGALVLARALGAGSGSDSKADPASSTASAAVVRGVTSVPSSTFDKVGVGSAQNAPKKVDAPALTADGKPRVLYVGAEYCPYCAAERWAVAVALARFGTWNNLGVTTSSSQDAFPDTATLSFHGATFSSDYLSFTGAETSDREGKPLDSLSPEDQKVFETYDRPPYTSGSAGSIPFIDIGGTYISSGASYSPEVLAGKTHEEIAKALADPNSDIAKGVDGVANVLTAAICETTKGQPANVCDSAGVKAAASALAKAQQK